MSNNYWEDEEEDTDTTAYGQQTEQDQLNQARKRERQKDKRIKELEEKVQTFERVSKETSIKSILEKKGVPAKASKFILKDLEGDVTEESISNWLNDYAELFNIKTDSEQETPAASDENRQAIARQDSATQGVKTPTQAESIQSKLDDPNLPEDEFKRIMGWQ